jgi:RNA polymerase sigma factor (sigma-70 family)
VKKNDAIKDILHLQSLGCAIANDKDLGKDLFAEAILVFLESKETFENVKHCEAFVAKTMWQMWAQTGNDFQKKYRPRDVYEDLDNIEVVEDEEYGKREFVNINLAKKALESVYWYNAELLKLYAEGKSYRQIAKETGIKLGSVYTAIQRAKKEIKEYLNL